MYGLSSHCIHIHVTFPNPYTRNCVTESQSNGLSKTNTVMSSYSGQLSKFFGIGIRIQLLPLKFEQSTTDSL